MTINLDLKKVFIAALATTAAGLVSACGVGQASATDESEQAVSTPLPVEVVLPMKAEIFATYHTTTTISSDADAPVPARVAGEVVDILVEAGNQVARGQVLGPALPMMFMALDLARRVAGSMNPDGNAPSSGGSPSTDC